MRAKTGPNDRLTKNALAFVIAIVFAIGCSTSAMAQVFNAPSAPPPGSGSNPPPVNPGDAGGNSAPPSGASDPTPGHNFPTGAGKDRSIVRVYHQGARGEKEVTTIRPDTLSNDAISQIEGILGVNMRSGEQQIEATASDAQMEQINDALAPYPQATNNGGRKFIDSDSPGNGYPKPDRNSLYGYTPDHPLPTVWTFSRYLVILGVVSATIFMSMAAYSMVMGNPYGGSRVFGAAAGMMLLLSAYTIWKIVQMNTYNANSDTPAQNVSRPSTAQVQDAFMSRANTPDAPGASGSNGRSGVPVEPLYGH